MSEVFFYSAAILRLADCVSVSFLADFNLPTVSSIGGKLFDRSRRRPNAIRTLDMSDVRLPAKEKRLDRGGKFRDGTPIYDGRGIVRAIEREGINRSYAFSD